MYQWWFEWEHKMCTYTMGMLEQDVALRLINRAADTIDGVDFRVGSEILVGLRERFDDDDT